MADYTIPWDEQEYQRRLDEFADVRRQADRDALLKQRAAQMQYGEQTQQAEQDYATVPSGGTLDKLVALGGLGALAGTAIARPKNPKVQNALGVGIGGAMGFLRGRDRNRREQQDRQDRTYKSRTQQAKTGLDVSTQVAEIDRILALLDAEGLAPKDPAERAKVIEEMKKQMASRGKDEALTEKYQAERDAAQTPEAGGMTFAEFLDNPGNMSMEQFGKLPAAVQTDQYQRLGGQHEPEPATPIPGFSKKTPQEQYRLAEESLGTEAVRYANRAVTTMLKEKPEEFRNAISKMEQSDLSNPIALITLAENVYGGERTPGYQQVQQLASKIMDAQGRSVNEQMDRMIAIELLAAKYPEWYDESEEVREAAIQKKMREIAGERRPGESQGLRK